MSVTAVGYAVVARRRGNTSEFTVITSGIEGYQAGEYVRAYHAQMQERTPSYHEGCYISLLNPSEYAAWLREQGKTPVCHACGKPVEP